MFDIGIGLTDCRIKESKMIHDGYKDCQYIFCYMPDGCCEENIGGSPANLINYCRVRFRLINI